MNFDYFYTDDVRNILYHHGIYPQLKCKLHYAGQFFWSEKSEYGLVNFARVLVFCRRNQYLVGNVNHVEEAYNGCFCRESASWNNLGPVHHTCLERAIGLGDELNISFVEVAVALWSAFTMYRVNIDSRMDYACPNTRYGSRGN